MPEDLWEELATAAAAESPLWVEALLPDRVRDLTAIFSPFAEERFALAIETIYEGYLVHYGRSRLFAAGDGDTALLLGDDLYAHGLVRIARLGAVEPVADLADLISLCAQLRADGAAGDGVAWAATAARLGEGVLAEARAALRDAGDAGPLRVLAAGSAGAEALDRALAAHSARLG